MDKIKNRELCQLAIVLEKQPLMLEKFLIMACNIIGRDLLSKQCLLGV